MRTRTSVQIGAFIGHATVVSAQQSVFHGVCSYILAATLPAFENPLQGIMNFLLLSAFTVAELACFFIALIDLFKGVLVNNCLVNPRYQAILCFNVSGVYEMRDDALHRLAIPRHILPCFRILDVGAFFVI